MYRMMTPGPTMVRENVRLARSMEAMNPDIDSRFYEEYRRICQKISRMLYTENESFLLCGEGILGLEAACASLTQPGDRVLVLDNGIFGRGFQDFVTLYGGRPVLYTVDDKEPIQVEGLKRFLERDHDFTYATLVHCDTPSGILNDVEAICPLLKQYGILTVVDSVSAMFGHSLHVDKGQIDIVCGGSQKALSAPIGLTLVTISQNAFRAMEERNVPIASFYANLLAVKDYYQNQWFPYSMPASDIHGLGIALDNIIGEKGRLSRDVLARHENLARAVRQTLVKAGLSLYLLKGYSNTVTAVRVPEGMKDKEILNTMKEKYGIMIAGSFDYLAGKVIRIGHMGENANVEDLADTLWALTETFRELGHPLSCNMKEEFLKACNPI